jgi:hypothetical protein
MLLTSTAQRVLRRAKATGRTSGVDVDGAGGWIGLHCLPDPQTAMIVAVQCAACAVAPDAGRVFRTRQAPDEPLRAMLVCRDPSDAAAAASRVRRYIVDEAGRRGIHAQGILSAMSADIEVVSAAQHLGEVARAAPGEVAERMARDGIGLIIIEGIESAYRRAWASIERITETYQEIAAAGGGFVLVRDETRPLQRSRNGSAAQALLEFVGITTRLRQINHMEAGCHADPDDPLNVQHLYSIARNGKRTSYFRRTVRAMVHHQLPAGEWYRRDIATGVLVPVQLVKINQGS